MITPAELPINHRGAVYHLDLRTEEIADLIITVGDPGRVSLVSQHFDKIEVQRSHREFVTHTGYLGTNRITVLSTGIGMPNIDIVMNELDALANIDLSTRTVNTNKKSLTIIRLGTTGGVTASCLPGDIAISRYAIGFDSLIDYYQYQPMGVLETIRDELSNYLKGESGPFYISESCPHLAEQFSALGHTGITATCGGFYGPQGRQLRMPLHYPNLISQLGKFCTQNYSVINLEMETAAIYALGSMLGHKCLSLSVVINNRIHGSFVTDVKSCLYSLITKSLANIKNILEPYEA
ncbi:nucleoside phosphorylase [Legionella pneumophila serogroup 1]